MSHDKTSQTFVSTRGRAMLTFDVSGDDTWEIISRNWPVKRYFSRYGFSLLRCLRTSARERIYRGDKEVRNMSVRKGPTSRV